ncbi:PP2C family protein-serine/threonine phosphatase [Patescibacteria group bacterium]
MSQNPEKSNPVPEEMESPEAKELVPFDAGFVSEKGTHHIVNQDSYLVDGENGIFLVADGMGGHSKGEQASQLSCESFAKRLKSRNRGKLNKGDLQQMVADLDVEVRKQWENDEGKPPGSTLTGIVEIDGEWWLVHVGDSRVYRWRDGKLEQLTQDHTWAEWMNYEPGTVGYEKLSNVLLNSIGGGKNLSKSMVDVAQLDRQLGDLYIIASDGIAKTGEIDSTELIAKVLKMMTDRDASAEQIAAQLVQYVQQAVPSGKRRDDITVGVLQDQK